MLRNNLKLQDLFLRITKKDLIVLSLFFVFGLFLRIQLFDSLIKYPWHGHYFYIKMAKNILQGSGVIFPYDVISYGLIKQPLYSLFISTFHLFIDNWERSVIIADLTLQSFLVYPIFSITKLLSNKKSAYISCVLFSFVPIFIFSIQVYGLFLFLLSLLVLLIIQKRRDLFFTVLFGVLLALAWLTRYETIFYIPVFLLFYLKEVKKPKYLVKTLLIIFFSFSSISYATNYVTDRTISISDRIIYRFMVSDFFFMRNLRADESFTRGEFEDFTYDAVEAEYSTVYKKISRYYNSWPMIYRNNLGVTLKDTYDLSLTFFLLLFSLIGFIYIKKKALILTCIVIPFSYAPLLRDDYIQYSVLSVLIIVILASVGINKLVEFLILKRFLPKRMLLICNNISKIKNNSKEVNAELIKKIFKETLAYLLILIPICFSLVTSKFPKFIEFLHNESTYEYKEICSKDSFRKWIKKNVPSNSKIVMPEDMTPYLLINNYHLFMFIEKSMDNLLNYAEVNAINYFLFDGDEIDLKASYFLYHGQEFKWSDFNLLDTLDLEGKVFYLLKYNI